MKEKQRRGASLPEETESVSRPEETISADGTDDSDLDIQTLFRKYLANDEPGQEQPEQPEPEPEPKPVRRGGLLSRLRELALDAGEAAEGETVPPEAFADAVPEDGQEEELQIIDGAGDTEEDDVSGEDAASGEDSVTPEETAPLCAPEGGESDASGEAETFEVADAAVGADVAVDGGIADAADDVPVAENVAAADGGGVPAGKDVALAPEDAENGAYDEAEDAGTPEDGGAAEAGEDGYPDEYAGEAAEVAEEEAGQPQEEIDDTDINLMVAFGMDAELKKKLGAKAAEKIRSSAGAPAPKIVRETVEYEFTDRSQIGNIAAAYKSSFRTTLIKTLIAAGLALYLLFYENVSLLGIQFSGVLDPKVYPVVYIMLGLQVGILACACAYEQIFKGFRRLFGGHPSAESIPAVMLTVSAVYSVVLAVTASSAKGELQLFNAPLAVCAVLVLLHDLLGIRREMYTFNIVSSKKPKYTMRRIEAKDAPAETEAFQTGSDVLKMERASFVDGFFSRVCTSDRQNSATIGFLSVIIPLASVLMGLIAAYSGHGDNPVRTAGMTFGAAYPLALLLVYSLPFFRAARSAYDNDCAIVGECSLEEYADASLVSVDESIVYPAYGVKVQNIRVFNNYRIDKALYFVASVFRKTGGPLSEVFQMATGDVGFSEDVELLRCGPGLLSAKVNGRTVTFGKRRNLVDAGFADVMPEEETDDPELCLMYMFRDDILVAEMYVKYTMDSDFEYLLNDLGGMSVCIRSFDPNIDEELLMKKIDLEKNRLRVVKQMALQDAEAVRDRVDSGLVTRGVPKTLLQTQPYCDDVLRARRLGERVSWISVLLTLVLTAVLLLGGKAGAVNSLYVTLYQALWAVPALLLSRKPVQY